MDERPGLRTYSANGISDTRYPDCQHKELKTIQKNSKYFRRAGIWLLAIYWLALGLPKAALAKDIVHIGVLSYRPLEETQRAWAPTATWLDKQIPGYRFHIEAYYFPELVKAIAEGKVRFVLTNPEHFVLLHANYGLTAIATLMPLVTEHPINRFGGVIFTRADREDIQQLSDLRSKRISAVSEHSLGGYLAQCWTLLKAGVDPRKEVKLQFTGMPQDQVVREVLEGDADAGFVRTGILENAIRAGKLDETRIKVLNLQAASHFPQRLSTNLYPEWPFASMPKVGPDLRKAVALALLNMPADSEAAQKGGYYGFSPPASYADVEALMVRFGIHPYRKDFGWRDVFEKFAIWIVAGMSLIVLASIAGVRLLRGANRALNRALEETHLLATQRSLLLASLGEGVYGIDTSGRCTFINPTALALLGYEQHEVLGKDQHLLFHHHKEEGSPYPHEDCPIHQTLQDGIRRDVKEILFRKSGELFHVRMTATAIREGGKIVGAVVVFQDTTREIRNQARTRLLETALKAADNSIVITDRNGTIEWVNPALSRLTGYTRQEALGQNPRVLKSGVHESSFYEEMWQTITSGIPWHGDVINRRKDGSTYSEEMTITPVMDEKGAIRHFIAVKQDVTERKNLEEELRRMATSDPLTGIANRRYFIERLQWELQRVARYGDQAALLMLDLDHFKRINDIWGHAVGDAVLVHFTTLVRQHLRATDLVGRLGGEEFAILLPETSPAGTSDFAGRLCRQVAAASLDTENGEINYTASIGITHLDPNDETPDDALERADKALYRAKANGRNRVEQ